MPDGLALPVVAAPILRLDGVSRKFGAAQALDCVSFEAPAGQILGVIGRSGSGKSTLVRCLNGLERPDEGVIEVEGRNIARLSERELQRVRQRSGTVFQHFNLLSAITVAQNVALPLKIARCSWRDQAARVEELPDLVGLSTKADVYPAQLSGGQKQRVGIARALAARPSLLLSDEATSALDPETTRSIVALLRDINRRLGLTIIFVTHEMSVLRLIADRVVVLDHRRVVEHGAAGDVLAAPCSDVTASLLRSLHLMTVSA